MVVNSLEMNKNNIDTVSYNDETIIMIRSKDKLSAFTF